MRWDDVKRKECVAMLLAGGQGSRLGGLTSDIAKPAVIFGGKYRIIDFALSNCSYSEIDTVGVLTQYKPLLLNAYIGTGSSWALDAVEGGVRILPPYVTKKGGKWYSGTADAIYQNIEYLDYYNPEYVLVISGDQVYKMDYSIMIQRHKKRGADVSISVIEVPLNQAHRFGVMVADEEDRIIEFQEKPENPESNLASMGIYLFDWKILRSVLIKDHDLKKSNHDFGKNIIPMLIEEGKEVLAYRYKGYWRDVGTIESYYEANMDLLSSEPELDLYDPVFRIFSNNENVQPHYVEEGAIISNSLICDGCTILGRVENSVVGNDVFIGEKTIIKDSILLRNVRIHKKSVVEKAILGENVQIDENKAIKIADGTNKIQVIFE